MNDCRDFISEMIKESQNVTELECKTAYKEIDQMTCQEFRLQYGNDENNGPDGSNDEDNKPLAPSNLRAVEVGSNQIKLTWVDNSDNEDGFRLMNVPDIVATFPSNTTSCVDTGLHPSTAQMYFIYAFNAYGQSDPSNPVQVVTAPPSCVKGEWIEFNNINMQYLINVQGYYTLTQIGNYPDHIGNYLVVNLSAQNKLDEKLTVFWWNTRMEDKLGNVVDQDAFACLDLERYLGGSSKCMNNREFEAQQELDGFLVFSVADLNAVPFYLRLYEEEWPEDDDDNYMCRMPL
ncbi:MAG: fibronectin type III domain-containing protein [bacterium]|nr:fibronectin type III domain-containing protein [bacterium]